MAIQSIQPQPLETQRQMPEHAPRKSVSLFWPTMLIGAGVLLILNNLGRVTGDWVSILIDYWPVIFIVIGIDILFSRTGWLGTLISGLVSLAVVLGLIYLLTTPGAQVSLGERITFPSSAALRTDQLAQPLGGVRNTRIELSLAGGNTVVSAMSDSARLFEGTYAHRGSFTQEIVGSGSDVTVRLGGPARPAFVPYNPARERMELKLNTDATYDLQLSFASGKHMFNLSELNLRGVTLNQASGSTELKLPETAPYPVEVNMASGTVTLIVPRGLPVRVETTALSGSVRRRALRRVSGNNFDGVYETPGFTRSGSYLDVNVNMLSGQVVIE